MKMASVQKFGNKIAVSKQINHIERLVQGEYSNTDIDKDRISNDYTLIDRDMSSYDYYLHRLSQCRVQNRKDVKTAFGWIITKPKDVPPEKEVLFFKHCSDFLCQRYGGDQNCISAVVHKDETGEPHMHWLGMPIVKNEKKTAVNNQDERINMSAIINKKDLRTFHKDLDKWLKSKGMSCSVYTGVTARQGGNRTVKELKAERDVQREVKRERTPILWT